MNPSRAVVPLFVASLSLLVAGCGGGVESAPTAAVTGKVTYDGESVSGGRLTFAPVAEEGDAFPGKPATVAVESDGTYSGQLVVGNNRVSYVAPSSGGDGDDDEAGAGEEGHVEAPPPSPYVGLSPKEETVEVPEGGGEIDIELVAP